MNALQIVEELLRQFASAIPKFIGALLVFLIGYIASRMISRFVRKVLQRIGIDKLAERLNEIDIVYRSRIKIVPSMLLSRILYYLLLFIFIIAATDVLGMQAVSDLMNSLLNYIPNLISALIVFVLGILLADFLKNIVLTACHSLGIPAAGTISNVVFYFMFLNVAMITLSQAQIDTNFIQDNLSIILAGVVLAFAIGYGFASRPILANLLAAYYNKEKVKLGDQLIIDGEKGEIIAMDNATFTLASEDGRRIVLPLSKLFSEKYEILPKDE